MRIRNYILSRLENFENKAPIVIENFTIEHIMPQNKHLSSEWHCSSVDVTDRQSNGPHCY